MCECVCLAVWYFLKEFPPTVRAEPPWAPQQSNPQTDPVLLPERKRETWQQYGVSLDVKVYKYKEALIKLLHTENQVVIKIGRLILVSPVLPQATDTYTFC